MNRMKMPFVTLILVVLMSCIQKKERHQLRTGDILFRGRQSSELSQAIDEVTQTGNDQHYTHMGIVELYNDTIWVIHATPVKGVCKETLTQFCLSGQDSTLIGHYRINGIEEELITSAIDKAYSTLGQPYNYSYILEDEGYYCSEFVYELFVSDSVFKLEPMTFIDPSSRNFHQGWVKHYKSLGIDIPEGQLGCNPNGMAASDQLEFLGFIKN